MTLHHSWESYLAATPEVDYDHPAILAFLETTDWRSLDEVERTKHAFEFVRDKVRHSWDAQDSRVTCSASEVLEHRTGLCYSKAHLLAALLRATGIPAGMCYQRLVLFDDPADGYSLHALNAAYLPSLDRWVRFDARGNKPGVAAEFGLDQERLAFAVRPEMGEVDYPGVYAEPPSVIVETLRTPTDATDLYARGLPSAL